MAQKEKFGLNANIDYTINKDETIYTFSIFNELTRQYARYVKDLFLKGNDLIFMGEKIYISSIEQLPFTYKPVEFTFKIIFPDREERESKKFWEFMNMNERPHYDSLAKLKS